MHREPLPGDRDTGRQQITKPQPVGERSKRVQADMSHDTLAGPFHHHRNRAVTVHLRSALLVGAGTTTVWFVPHG